MNLNKPHISVILDANFLFIPLRFGIDIFEELQRLFGNVRCVVTTPVIDELRLLRVDSKPSLIRDIDFAIKMTKRCDVMDECLKTGETVDDSIVRVAKETRFPVATNDAELKRRLKKEGIPVVYLRKRSYLEVDGVV
ncbi:MAG: hypothetical protein JSV18_04570 [Candidatus Bathyarchaeota archaeon]|nr:MAG: hypothetical protein JSV18_04570 [Candidatus Bathyarchaeota archaeon]